MNPTFLPSGTARRLYQDYAEPLPLLAGLDGSGRLSAREIWENRRFASLSELWLEDPDKIRLMRANAVAEDYFTGQVSAQEQLEKFAETVTLAPGNPQLRWCRMDLEHFFAYEGDFSLSCLDGLWALTCRKLQEDESLTLRGLLRRAGVSVIATADDAADSLVWHEKLARDPAVPFAVLPTFVPDKALAIRDDCFAGSLRRLAESAGRDALPHFADVCSALSQRLQFFRSRGCRAARQTLGTSAFDASPTQAERVYQKRLAGLPLCREEAEIYRGALAMHLGREYADLGLVMVLVPGTGTDSSFPDRIAAFLSALGRQGPCPRTLLPSVCPGDGEALDALLCTLPADGFPGWFQYGCGLYPHDPRRDPAGLFQVLARVGVLGNFVGLTGSAGTLLPYAPHADFRMSLCRVLAGWVEQGVYPAEELLLKMVIQGVCWSNARRFFDLP